MWGALRFFFSRCEMLNGMGRSREVPSRICAVLSHNQPPPPPKKKHPWRPFKMARRKETVVYIARDA